MKRGAQDPLEALWTRIGEAVIREFSGFVFGPGRGRSAGRKDQRREPARLLDRTLYDAYQALGVLPSAPRTVIEAAYRALARDAHPDVGGSEARMQALNAAMAAIRKERGWKR
jgi:hypothetical protein